MSRHYYKNDEASAFVGGVLGITLILLLVLAFLLVRLGKKIAEAFAANPKSPALLIPLFGIVVCSLIAAMTRDSIQTTALVCAGLCLIAFCIGAVGVSMHHDPLMHENTPLSKALRRDWWADSNAVQQAA